MRRLAIFYQVHKILQVRLTSICIEMWELVVISRLILKANHACWLRDTNCGVSLQLNRKEKILPGGGRRRTRRAFKNSSREKESVGARRS